jgi:hypothetical protein
MATDGVPASQPVTRIEQGSNAPQTATIQKATGKPLPTSGHILPAKAAAQPAEPDFQALIAHLNKHLNDTGQPNQFRVDTSSGSKLIQEINPASGEVVGEYLIAEFPALARGLGVSGLVIDSHA